MPTIYGEGREKASTQLQEEVEKSLKEFAVDLNVSTIYPALDQVTRSIRLIELLPGDSNSSISCKFQVSNLANCPPYIALSYTWGPPSPTKEILVDGKQFPIRENLWLALNAIRKRIVDSAPEARNWKLFWADAICINQNDILERNHQVELMSEIYSQADLVITWLGEARDNSTVALKLLTEVYQSVLCGGFDPILFLRQVSPREKMALLEFLRRSYWKRVWIVQEILLAKDIILLCGDEACKWIVISNSRDVLLEPDISFIQTPGYHIIRTRDQWTDSGWESKRSLQTLVELLPDIECQDQRDHIFGLLGLLPEDKRVRVDYRSSAYKVLDEAVLFLRNEPTLDDAGLIRMASRLEKCMGLNSIWSLSVLEWLDTYRPEMYPRPSLTALERLENLRGVRE